MNLAATTAGQWTVSTRRDGEVLAIWSGEEGLSLGVLASGGAFTPLEFEGWLNDLVNVARETARVDTAFRPIPALLHQALTGLLFSHAELWERGGGLYCSIAFVATAKEVAVGWVGEADVQVLMGEEWRDSGWITVRDSEGREARAAKFDGAQPLHVVLQWDPGVGPDTGVRVDAYWRTQPIAEPPPDDTEAAPWAELTAIHASPLPGPEAIDEFGAKTAAAGYGSDLSELENDGGAGVAEAEIEEEPRERGRFTRLWDRLGHPVPGETKTEDQRWDEELEFEAELDVDDSQLDGLEIAEAPSWDESVKAALDLEPDATETPAAEAEVADDHVDVAPADAGASAEADAGAVAPKSSSETKAPPPVFKLPDWATPAPERDEATRGSETSHEAESTGATSAPSMFDHSSPSRPSLRRAGDAVRATPPPAPAPTSPEIARPSESVLVSPVESSAVPSIEPYAVIEPSVDGAHEIAPEAAAETDPDLIIERDGNSFFQAGHIPVTPAADIDRSGMPQLPREVTKLELDEPANAQAAASSSPAETAEVSPLVESTAAPRTHDLVADTLADAPALPQAEAAVTEPAAADLAATESELAAPTPTHSLASTSLELDERALIEAALAPLAEAPIEAHAEAAPEPHAEAVIESHAETAVEPRAEAVIESPVETSIAPAAEISIVMQAASAAAPVAKAEAVPRAAEVRAPIKAAWPSPDEITAAVPLYNQWWLWTIIVLALFAVGWILGGLATDGSTSPEKLDPVSRFIQGLGLGASRFEAVINSQPDGAWIAVDGREISRRTPAKIQLKPGPHQITLSMAERGSANISIQGRRGEHVELNEPMWGALSIDQPDATVPITVDVDGRPVGFAPVTVDTLSPGAHEVRFSAPEMTPWAQTVEVKVRETAHLAAHPIISPATGMLVIRATLSDEQGSSPLSGGEVWVDGDLAGRTPLSLELPRGPHSVRVAYRGEAAPVQVIELPGGNQRFAMFELGFGSGGPRLVQEEALVRVSTDTPAPIVAMLDGVNAADVREMWLHVRSADSNWHRYALTVKKMPLGVEGSINFPVEEFDETGRTQYYLSALTATGDEYFTEVASVQRVGTTGGTPSPAPAPATRSR